MRTRPKRIHPVERRNLTNREAARIQSFSDSFIFAGTRSSVRRQIGNAVPPELSVSIAEELCTELVEERQTALAEYEQVAAAD